ncbi:MAG: hypothetical protein QNJ53_31215 [Pleurocapsa sp. MO_192.B19]|nr:hypothetical protein [Pleurocapsa sp. MO_192.B19]
MISSEGMAHYWQRPFHNKSERTNGIVRQQTGRWHHRHMKSA